MTPEERARRSAEAMWSDDRASQGLGMSITAIGPGQATLTMALRDDMANGHGIAHGGFIFALADSAFAFACNSYNHLVVAQHNSITYLSPGHVGEILTASATEAHLRRDRVRRRRPPGGDLSRSQPADRGLPFRRTGKLSRQGGRHEGPDAP